jgi:Zn finger protein HypA/HybF involved in hydrogenase expression
MFLRDVKSIAWNDKERSFDVKITTVCTCGGMLIVERLPVLIAQTSSCACGSNLVIKDYSISKRDKEIDFDATYQCPKCNKTRKRLIRGLASRISRVWYDTSRVEIGLDGIKYEKRSQEEGT